jgi:hypothetical protein
VSKSSGKSQRSGGNEAGRKTAKAAEENTLWSSPFAQWAIAAAAGLAILAYLALFFTQNLAPNAALSRFSLFFYLLTPDDLAKDWVEGSWRNFVLVDRWPLALVAIVLSGVALVVGSMGLWMSRALRKTMLLDRYILGLGLGLQLLSLLALFGGLLGTGFGILPFLIKLTVYFICWFGMFWVLRRITRQPPLPQTRLQPPPFRIPTENLAHRTLLVKIVESLLIYAIAFLSVAIILGAMLPPWDFDVREYHLQVPKEWSQQGQITFLPHNVYGNMPLGAEMHAYGAMQLIQPSSTPRYWWWGALAGKLMMALYGPLTALLLYCAGRRFWSNLAGLTAAVVYLSNPWVIHACVNGLNESALGFYLMAALYAALLGGKGRPCAGLSGFFAGAAASIKYTGVVFVVFPLGLLMIWNGTRWLGRWHDPRSPQKLRWRPHAAIFLVMMLLSCGLWYGKNLAFTGNPVYPLMGSILGGATRTPEKTERWNRAHKPPAYTIKELAKSAVSLGWKDQFQSPLMVPLTGLGIVALAIAARNRNRKIAASSTLHPALYTLHSIHVLAVSTIFVLFFLAAWWLFTHRLERFLVPAIPLAALLAGAGVEFARGKPLRYVVAGLMVSGLTYNLLMAASPLVGDNRWFVSLERLRTDEPKTDQDPSRVKAAIRWLNEHAKPDEAVLCVGEAAVFDLEMPVFYNTCFDDCLLVNWTENKTPAERTEELRSRKIAYVYFDEAEIKRYRSNNNYGFDQPRGASAAVA